MQPPLAVVCHDAGAAHALLAWLAHEGHRPRAWMQGPAAQLWSHYFPQLKAEASLDAALQGAATVLTGTGWASSIEHEARRQARALGQRTVALIDHWVNYAARFERNGDTVLPDELWVTDEYALAEAMRVFPGAVLRVIPNHYVRRQLTAVTTPADPDAVLMLMEPARSDWGRGTPGEFQALDYFIAHRHHAGIRSDAMLRLRPHPSDPHGKYVEWLQRHPQVILDDTPTLADALNTGGWVAGMESFALTVALQAGRHVLCVLPPWAPPCRLPHDGLVHLKDLAR